MILVELSLDLKTQYFSFRYIFYNVFNKGCGIKPLATKN